MVRFKLGIKTAKKNKSGNEKEKSILTIDNIIFTGLLLILFLYFGFQTFYLQTDAPQVAVTTTSMVPSYYGFDISYGKHYTAYDSLRGDLLIVQKKPVHIGDTIVFQLDYQEVAIVHRVVAEKTIGNERYFGTKGDHNEISDISSSGNNFGWINEKYVKGVVIFSIHNIGWFSLELQNPIIRLILIISMLLIIGIGVLEYLKSKDEDPNKIEDSRSQTRINMKKKIYLTWRKKKILISRPKMFVFFLLLTMVATGGVIGYSHYVSGANSVEIYTKTGNQISSINLGLADVEDYSSQPEAFYLYNFKMLIVSNGVFNWVNRIEMQVIYDGYSADLNPTYVWTLVYDYAGQKEVNPVLTFKVVNTNQVVNAQIEIQNLREKLIKNPENATSILNDILSRRSTIKRAENTLEFIKQEKEEWFSEVE